MANEQQSEASIHQIVNLAKNRALASDMTYELGGVATAAGTINEHTITDTTTGTMVYREEGWARGATVIPIEKATVHEIGHVTDTVYNSLDRNHDSKDQKAIEYGKEWGPKDDRNASGVDVVRTDKAGNEVYRHTVKSRKFAHAVGKRAAGKIVSRIPQ